MRDKLPCAVFIDIVRVGDSFNFYRIAKVIKGNMAAVA